MTTADAAPEPVVQVCACGHSLASHQSDTGECWGHVLDADDAYCRCSGYVEGGEP